MANGKLIKAREGILRSTFILLYATFQVMEMGSVSPPLPLPMPPMAKPADAAKRNRRRLRMARTLATRGLPAVFSAFALAYFAMGMAYYNNLLTRNL